jgi:adenosylcobinamide amidohydrolase
MSSYRPRSQTWRLEEGQDGTVEIWLNRQRKRSANGMIDAVRWVRKYRAPDESVKHIDADGAERDVTRRLFDNRRLFDKR